MRSDKEIRIRHNQRWPPLMLVWIDWSFRNLRVEKSLSLCLPIIPREATAVYWLANLYIQLQNESMVNPRGPDIKLSGFVDDFCCGVGLCNRVDLDLNHNRGCLLTSGIKAVFKSSWGGLGCGSEVIKVNCCWESWEM